MENKRPDIYKLKTMEVVKESLYLYKNNYKLLLKISLISFLISMINTVFSYFLTISEISAANIVITLAISLLVIYFKVMLTVAMYISISNRYSGKLITFREAFEKSKESVWTYIGTGILFILIMLPSVLIGLGVYLTAKTDLLKYLLLLIVAVPSIYLAIIYEFAPLASVIEKGKAYEEGKASYFKLSKRLVQNNFWRITLLMASMILIINLPSLFITNINPWFKALSALNQTVMNLLHDFLFVFVSPAVSCLIVVLYLTLREKVVFKQQ
jgi:hypothetical protein